MEVAAGGVPPAPFPSRVVRVATAEEPPAGGAAQEACAWLQSAHHRVQRSVQRSAAQRCAQQRSVPRSAARSARRRRDQLQRSSPLPPSLTRRAYNHECRVIRTCACVAMSPTPPPQFRTLVVHARASDDVFNICM